MNEAAALAEVAKYLSPTNENVRRGYLVAAIRDLAQLKMPAIEAQRPPASAAPPAIDERTRHLLGGWTELMTDDAFRGALDAMSSDVLWCAQEFLQEHLAQIQAACDEADGPDIVSAVVGWTLGIPAGKKHDPDARLEEAFRHNAIAAYVSAFSAENSSRVFRRDTH